MHAGSNVIQMKDFKFDNNKNELSSITLMHSDNKLAQKSCDKLKKLDHSKVILKKADYPLFTSDYSFKKRVLVALSLGCDVFKGGIKGVGPPSIFDKFQNNSNSKKSIEISLQNNLIKKLNTKGSFIDAHMQALMFMPANEVTIDGKFPNNFYYLNHKPTKVHKYAADFMHPDDDACTAINHGTDAFNCKGYDAILPHECLVLEKEYCSYCELHFCRHCVISADGSDKLCIKYYKDLKVNGVPCTCTKDRPKLMQEIIETSHGGACTYLDKYSLQELQALRMEMIGSQAMTKNATEVKYPIMNCEKIFDNKTSQMLCKIDLLNEGGSFMSRKSLKKHLPGMMNC